MERVCQLHLHLCSLLSMDGPELSISTSINLISIRDTLETLEFLKTFVYTIQIPTKKNTW